MPLAQPTFSVIVPVYNDSKRLELCLNALARQSLARDSFEVLVVDNGSEMPPDEIVARYPFARVLLEANPGSYHARNAGCRVAAGEFLAFTDADCRPDPKWLSNALAYFRRLEAVAAIGGRIDLESTAKASAAEAFERVFAFRQDKYVVEYGFAATANLLVRRRAFDEVGAFNGSVKSGGDRDLCQRLHLAGHRMDYVADVVVVHPARATLRELIMKRRRLEGGHRSVSTLAQLSSEWKPGKLQGRPRGIAMALVLLIAPSRMNLAPWQGVQVLMVAGILAVVGTLERMRLRVGREPVR